MVPKFQFDFSHPAVKTILRLILPAVFGASIYQINVVVIRLLASFLPSGSVSYLYYADRLAQFPLGIFAVALGTAVLPSMSEMVVRNKIDELKQTFIDALSMTFYIALPAAVGLMVLHVPIISLLFFRGEFDFLSVSNTAHALLFFSVGLPAVSAVRVSANAFYAQKDTKTPVIIGSLSVLINIILSILLMRPMLHNGLALAVSLSALVNFICLLLIFRMRVGRLGLRRLLVSVLKTTVGCLVLGVGVWLLSLLAPWDTPGHTAEKVVVLTLSVLLGVLLFAGTTRLLGSPELSMILLPFLSKVKKGKEK
jgi:putative peptidoglycan lipid II flippase